jgi:hypothetical protein
MRGFLWKLLGYTAVAAALIGAFAVYTPEAFVLVPAGRDPAIVGDWYVERYGSFRRYQFKKDGTGYVWSPGRDVREFRWGTDGDRLRMKQRSNSGWQAPEFRIESDPSTGELLLEPEGAGWPLKMNRNAPESAKLD